MAIINLDEFFSSANYDTSSGILSINLATNLLKEQVVLSCLEALEINAQNKRTNLDFPIANKAFADNPSVSTVNRQNADNTQSELQIEKIFQFNGFYKLSIPTYVNAVNNSD